MTFTVVGTDVVAHDIRKGREHHFTYKINALDFLFEWYYFKILYIDACDVSFKLSIDSGPKRMLHQILGHRNIVNYWTFILQCGLA